MTFYTLRSLVGTPYLQLFNSWGMRPAQDVFAMIPGSPARSIAECLSVFLSFLQGCCHIPLFGSCREAQSLYQPA